MKLKQKAMELPKVQHSQYWWATKKELLAHKDVQQNSKNYFNGHKPFSNFK